MLKTMHRNYFLGLLLILSGCQAESSVSQNRDPKLDSRLKRIEQERLAPSGPITKLASIGNTRSPYQPDATPVVRTVRADAITASPAPYPDASSLTWNWTMSETGEDDLTPAEEDEAFWNDKAEKYNRRRPLNSFWDTVKRDLKCLPEDIWHDTKRVYGNPLNLVILGTTYAGSLALQETGPDDTVEDHYGPGKHTFSKDWRDAFGAIGNPGTHFALAGVWYLVGQQSMDDKTFDVGRTLFSALAINGVTVMLGQAASWDESPNGELGTFPSGHTSSSFVFASVMHEAYGHLVGIPLYGLATLAGIERLDDREHYFSDVVMGAVLGTVVGHSVASGHDPEFYGWKIAPWVNPNGGTGVAFVKTMK